LTEELKEEAASKNITLEVIYNNFNEDSRFAKIEE
jgi:hypothetical protein